MVARALQQSGQLESLHIDAWLRPGLFEALGRRIFGARADGRVVADIPAQKIHGHPDFFVINQLAYRARTSGRDTARLERMKARSLRRVARQCSSPAVFGMQWSAAELFEGRDCAVLEQFAAPAAADHELLEAERRRFPGWTHERLPVVPEWDERSAREWDLADVIWVPSAHLVASCERYGARPEKFRVLPYPVPAGDPPAVRHFDGRRRLRVAFAGSLILRKGVQYIYEALQGWGTGEIDMHFLGALELTELAARRLSEVGQLHGHLPRAELLAQLRQSDVLLFPSLSEGSALVLGEALSTGLPAIATPESAPPRSAQLIPARDPQAIRAALRRLLDRPALVEEMSLAAAQDASTRSPARFCRDLAALAREARGHGAAAPSGPR